MNRKSKLVVVVLALSLLLAVGCARAEAAGSAMPAPDAEGGSAPVEMLVDNGEPITNLSGFVEALRDQGAVVEETGEVEQPFLSVKGKSIAVNGQSLQIYEYAGAAEVEIDAAGIGPDGSPPTMMISWIDAPHFYHSGSLIVLYVGSDSETLQTLEDILGHQFAGQ